MTPVRVGQRRQNANGEQYVVERIEGDDCVIRNVGDGCGFYLELRDAASDKLIDEAPDRGPDEANRLHFALADAVKRNRQSAAGLRSEVERGVAIRQSPESKLLRAELLSGFADELEEIMRGEQ